MNEKTLKDRSIRRKAILDKIQKITASDMPKVKDKIAKSWIEIAGNWDPSRVNYVPFNLPVGREKFENFVKKELRNLGEEEMARDDNQLKAMVKSVANQINDKYQYPHPVSGIESSDTTLYKVRASLDKKAKTVYDDKHVEHDNLAPYSKPDEHSRYCPEHPGVQMRRVKDKVYQCPMNGDTFSYDGGHEITFETGVNQQTALFTDVRPRSAFTEGPVKDKYRSKKDYDYDREGLYGVEMPKKDDKEYHSFAKNPTTSIPKKSNRKGFCKTADEADDFLEQFKKAPASKEEYHCDECGHVAYGKMAKCPKCNANMEKKYILGESKIEKKAQLFGPTILNSRYCPDHPGEQMGRISDKVYQCSLDGKTYDFNQGFTTEDGETHEGGSIQNQKEFAIFRAPPRPFGQESSFKGFTKTAQEDVTSKDNDAMFASCALGYEGEEGREFAKNILKQKISDRRPLSEIIAEAFAKKKQKEEAEKLLLEQKVQGTE